MSEIPVFHYVPEPDPEADLWERFRREGGRLIDADGHTIAVIGPSEPAEEVPYLIAPMYPPPEDLAPDD